MTRIVQVAFLLVLIADSFIIGSYGVGDEDEKNINAAGPSSANKEDAPVSSSSPSANKQSASEPSRNTETAAAENMEATTSALSSTNTENVAPPPAPPSHVEISPTSSTNTDDSSTMGSVSAAPSTSAPSRSNESLIEVAKVVSLAPVDATVEYKKDTTPFLAVFSHHHRRKLCGSTQEALQLPNAEYYDFIFDLHLYEFEYPTGERRVFGALHCPTKSFPRIFLRLTLDLENVKVVIVPEEDLSPQHVFTLATATSIKPIQENDENERAKLKLVKHPVFSFNLEKRQALCNDAQKRFKYELTAQTDFVDEPVIYEFVFGDVKEIHAAIECPFKPTTMYLCFTNSDSEVPIKITFLDEIEEWIQKKTFQLKSDLIHVLRNIEIKKDKEKASEDKVSVEENKVNG